MYDELYHHGIKGQKWGVRRFQNEDGSLTSAGKKRLASTSDTIKRDALAKSYNDNIAKGDKNSIKQAKKDARNIAKLDDKAEAEARKAIKTQRKHNAKNASLLSDDELNAQINRLQRERQLKNLTSEVVTPGRYKAKQMLDRYGGQALSIAAGGVVTGIGMRYVNAMMDVNLARQGFKVKGYNADGTPNYGGGNNNNNDDD